MSDFGQLPRNHHARHHHWHAGRVVAPHVDVLTLAPLQPEALAAWGNDPDGRRNLTLPDAAGDAQLVVPRVCRAKPCSLVIVSHGRGGLASAGIQHAPFDSLLDAIDAQGFVLLLSRAKHLGQHGGAVFHPAQWR
ncbi:hypothetical protein FNU79_16615 [Deinococcus detaillensis]|uniref:Alpha/beta hydrolase n=1 Tax=Deinococcus detaillensis TaxID=2592048 RepID=A0A553UJI1_9DEIO|nr:hypothetical protein [Deinococcus detaillensis]TSA80349.1 hypothetical protein FNU79_16615 [Deinococcus detaillensis]